MHVLNADLYDACHSDRKHGIFINSLHSSHLPHILEISLITSHIGGKGSILGPM